MKEFIRLTGKYVNEPAVFFEKGCYSNGRLAIVANDSSGQRIATLSVNLPDKHLDGKSKSFFKNYNENEGMLECLEEQKIVQKTGRMVSSGFIDNIPEVEWLI